MKKLVILIILLISIFSFNSYVYALDEGSAKLVISGPRNAKPGEIITIDVRLDVLSYGDTTALVYLSTGFAFDGDKVEFLKYELIDASESSMPSNGVSEYISGYCGIAITTVEGKTERDMIFRATFKVKNDVPDGVNLKFTTPNSPLMPGARFGSSVLNPDIGTYGSYIIDMPFTGMTLAVQVLKDENSPKISETKKSSNSYLKSLFIEKSNLVPDFIKTTLEYSITVSYDIEELDIKFETEDAKASANINGNKDLKVGENVATILVTAEDGSKKTYTVNIIRENKLEVTEEPQKGNEDVPKTKENENNPFIQLIIGIGIVSVIGATSFVLRKKDLKR